ncbi:mitochondrial carrier domain-containing protein [Thamnocephalis sphaerospora]|uniref:Mitochondrial carrier domain-containing protein n=1 Tax=Thamnocephalis sphaerospora TaxID=78915 RepID=A0A4P9XVD6_9FUNG|nr:mitochondrial carrier domain-containing protein [Thamnocephalis sphaerospora]|eukprot:RKP10218.1 mitochondrial carrier domain-containing protein [Thamnocephalis sphaerospora]
MAFLNDHTREFVAGTMGGWAQVVVGHPFDTLKVRLQTQTHPPRFHNGMDCLRVTLKEEGPQGLYKGVMSPLAGIGICNAVLFAANGYFRGVVRENRADGNMERPFTIPELMVAGGLGGIAMAFANCPVQRPELASSIESALADYNRETREGLFPAPEHCLPMAEIERERLDTALRAFDAAQPGYQPVLTATAVQEMTPLKPPVEHEVPAPAPVTARKVAAGAS